MSRLRSKSFGRFAPTPSGELHFGSLVTAMASFIDVKSVKGVWWLRIEDIDSTRSKVNSSKIICDQLLDHGLNWNYWPDEKGGVNGVLFQSKRNWYYQEAFHKLVNNSKIYGCSCSRKEIKALFVQGKTQKLLNGEISYPGICKKKTSLGMLKISH